MLKVGDKAPNFRLQNHGGEWVDSKSLLGSRIVLYFYPKDSTSGCTKEACGFSELSLKFKRKNTQIFGVSKDSLASHQKFIEKYSLKIPLLSDPTCGVAKAFGAWGKKSMYGKTYFGMLRNTYVISPQGKIEKIYEKVKAEPHPAEVLENLD